MAIGLDSCSPLTRELEKIKPMLGINEIVGANKSIPRVIAFMETFNRRGNFRPDDFAVPIAGTQFKLKRIGDRAEIAPTTEKDSGEVSGALYITSRRMRSYTTPGESEVWNDLEIFANVNVGGCTGTVGGLSLLIDLNDDVNPLKHFVEFAIAKRSIEVIAYMIFKAYDEACEKLSNRVAARHLDYIK